MGPVQVARLVYSEGRAAGFYRGLFPNLIGVTPEKAIKLGVNDIMRDWMTASNQRAGHGSQLSVLQQVLAGASAGLAQCIATNPMEVSKIHMQESATGTTMEAVSELGLTGLYRGVHITLLRDIPFSVIMFPGYAMTAAAIQERFKAQLPAGQTELSNTQQVLATFTAGAVAGSLGSGLVTPMDVIKTRVQGKQAAKYDGLVDCFKKVTKAEGFMALWAGLVPRMVVVGALFGVSMLAFEMLKIQVRAQRKKMRHDAIGRREGSPEDYAGPGSKPTAGGAQAAGGGQDESSDGRT